MISLKLYLTQSIYQDCYQIKILDGSEQSLVNIALKLTQISNISSLESNKSNNAFPLKFFINERNPVNLIHQKFYVFQCVT